MSLLIFSINRIAVADPAYVFSLCSDMQTVAPSSNYQTNVDALLSSFSSKKASESLFYNTTVGIGANKVYGFFFCGFDETLAICQKCISLAINSLNSRCRGQKESVVWYDQCLVRYSNESFFGTMNDAPMIPMWNRQNAVDIQNITNNQLGFIQVLLGTLRNVSSKAATGPSGKKIATKEGKFVANLTSMNLLYTLAECTPDISTRDCNTCLQMTIGNMTDMCNMKAGCTMMNPSCNIRYDVYAFYGDALTPTLGPPSVPFSVDTSRKGSRRKKALLIVGVSISVILAMVILIGAWILKHKKNSKKPIIEADEIETKIEESLLYRAWRLWNEGIPLKLTDPTFCSDFPVDEMAKCMHIGLLCVQDDAAKRPRMATIVGALNGESITLPLPTPPHFLSDSVDNGIKEDDLTQCNHALRVTEIFTELSPR
ncbi:hypothetical protein SOVF_090780 [Spinacia oleracea]|nr:hypothetical protein SOVF_090780 [Spinacia oleracea]